MSWTIVIGDQVSAPSPVLTAYAPSAIYSVSLVDDSSMNVNVGSSGGFVLRIVGDNFGRFGDAAIYCFLNGSISLVHSTVYVSNSELLVRQRKTVLFAGLWP